MWFVKYASGHVDAFETEEEFDMEIEDLAENWPFDLDVVGNICFVDNGDFDEEEEF